MVSNREAFFWRKKRTTAYSDRKRSISVLQSAISCDMDLYASVKPRRPCIFINLRDVSWRRLNALCHRKSKMNLSTQTHCAKAVLRTASTSSRGWGSCDKNSSSRRSREARSSRAALLRLVVCDEYQKKTGFITEQSCIRRSSG